jgi:hypothetical protein
MTTFVLVHGGYHGGWCFERVIEVASLDDGEHRSKYLLLLDRCTGLDIVDHRRLDKKSIFVYTASAGNDLSAFALAFFDVVESFIEGALIDDSRHVRVGFSRRTDLQCLRQRNDFLNKCIVDFLIDDQSRTR